MYFKVCIMMTWATLILFLYFVPEHWTISQTKVGLALTTSQNISKHFLIENPFQAMYDLPYFPSKIVPRKSTTLAGAALPWLLSAAFLLVGRHQALGGDRHQTFWRFSTTIRPHQAPTQPALLFAPSRAFCQSEKPYFHPPLFVDMKFSFRQFSLQPKVFINYILISRQSHHHCSISLWW